MVNPQPRGTQPARRARPACAAAAVVEQLVALRPRRFGYVIGPADDHSSMSIGPGSVARPGRRRGRGTERCLARGFRWDRVRRLRPKKGGALRAAAQRVRHSHAVTGARRCRAVPAAGCRRVYSSQLIGPVVFLRLAESSILNRPNLTSCSQLKLTRAASTQLLLPSAGIVSGIADPFNGHIDEFRVAHVQRSTGGLGTITRQVSRLPEHP
jgi:hypothetical protein